LKNTFLKQLTILCIIASLAVSAVSCGTKNVGNETSATKVGSTEHAPEQKDTTEVIKEDTSNPVIGTETVNELQISQKDGKDITLMVYMVGSDLESKAGAGTNDLDEMLKSGVDLSSVELIVYTGGSKHWHNDNSSDEYNSILHLTEDGFETVYTEDPVSMGESECLLSFLEYGYSEYPADEYALIMWDHGNGPVIGYGKDMLFKNDALTLLEMKNAFEASPFTGDNKLSFIGFDACLMASAELSCTLSGYADYLMASQEVEPSFGWNYSFLAYLGSMETPKLLEKLADEYIAYCDDYYERKGYSGKEYTLSCVDLSKADALGTAIEELFLEADDDAVINYDKLASVRADTRALGRASTGSEYDLVDILAMSEQLSELYPKETLALEEALSEAVLFSKHNTEQCCGLSLYYPFFNKYYYKDSWGEIYSELGIFPAYLDYLESYGKTWLGADKPLTAVQSSVSQSALPGNYTVELTDEQVQTFAKAKYYILERVGYDIYIPRYESEETELRGNTLYAYFDGNIIYARNDLFMYAIPMTVAKDTIGNTARYIVDSQLVDGTVHEIFNGYETDDCNMDFAIAVDKTTKEITIADVITSYGQSSDAPTLRGGKNDAVNLDEWDHYHFWDWARLYPKRYDNGVMCPISMWTESSKSSWKEFPVRNGLEFIYAPLVGDNAYMIIEITDTRGNSYCSEFLEIEGGTYEFPALEQETEELEWESGESFVFYDDNDITLSLKKTIEKDWFDEVIGETYTIVAENNSDKYYCIMSENPIFNGSILIPDAYFYINVDPRDTAEYSLELSEDFSIQTGVITSIEDLSFDLLIHDNLRDDYYEYYKPYHIKIAPDIATKHSPGEISKNLKNPIMGAFATEQEVFKNDIFSVSLLAFGANEYNSAPLAVFKIKNLSDKRQNIEIAALEINGITLDEYVTPPAFEIPAGAEIYCGSTFPDMEDEYLITAIENVSVCLEVSGSSSFSYGFAKYVWCDILLSESAKNVEAPPVGEVLYESEEIIVSHPQTVTNEYGNTDVYIMIENTSENDYELTSMPIVNAPGIVNVRAGGMTICRIPFFDDKIPEKLEFTLKATDLHGEILYFTTDTIELNLK